MYIESHIEKLTETFEVKETEANVWDLKYEAEKQGITLGAIFRE